MRLSIVFPAYNEELNIAEAIDQALQHLGNQGGEVIVVNDGSEDRTSKIVQTYVDRLPRQVRLINHTHRTGYGAALRDGFGACREDWIFYSDSDNQFDLSEIDRLVERSKAVDLVLGYRQNRQDSWVRKFAAFGFNRLVRLVFGLSVRDIDCSFKLFHRTVFDRIHLQENGFLIDLEILLKAKRASLRWKEVGVTHRSRRFGRSTVRLADVWKTILGMYRLSARSLASHQGTSYTRAVDEEKLTG